MLEIEFLILRDIANQLNQAENDYKWNFNEAYLHHLDTAKMFCVSLLNRLAEKLEEAKK